MNSARFGASWQLLQLLRHTPLSAGSVPPQLPSVDPLTLSRESGDGLLQTSSNLFWEERDRTSLTSPSSEASKHTDGGPEDPFVSSSGSVQWRSLRHEMEGGMELAGERPVADLADHFHQRNASAASTLPPPYSSEFGDPWYLCLYLYIDSF